MPLRPTSNRPKKSPRAEFSTWRPLLFLPLFILLFEETLRAQAQIPFVTGREPGPNPQENEWFYDTLRHRLDRWSENGWTPMDKRVDSAGACHAWVWSVSGKNVRLWDRRGEVVMNFPQRVECLDSMIAVEINPYGDPKRQRSMRTLNLYDGSGRLRHELQVEMEAWRYLNLAGQKALLLSETDFVKQERTLLFHQYRNWGVYGGNFRWLIPPIYDEPIRFVNGVAEVTTYGKRQRINEKGQVLE